MIPTAVLWGFFYSKFMVCFGTKYDANLEVLSCQVYFINLFIHQDQKNNCRVPFKIQKICALLAWTAAFEQSDLTENATALPTELYVIP